MNRFQNSPKALLQAGLSLLEHCENSLSEPLWVYLELLLKWNQRFNLTAITDPVEIISKHFLDSLSIGPFLRGSDIIDVGSGPGFPGIPLALSYPDKQFSLLDSNGKKTRFVQQAVQTLGLKNVTVIQSRVEKWLPEDKYSTVVSRAFAQINDMLTWCRHLCANDGCFLAMKANSPETELDDVPQDIRLEEVVPVTVPMLDAARQLVILTWANKEDEL